MSEYSSACFVCCPNVWIFNLSLPCSVSVIRQHYFHFPPDILSPIILFLQRPHFIPFPTVPSPHPSQHLIPHSSLTSSLACLSPQLPHLIPGISFPTVPSPHPSQHLIPHTSLTSSLVCLSPQLPHLIPGISFPTVPSPYPSQHLSPQFPYLTTSISFPTVSSPHH